MISGVNVKIGKTQFMTLFTSLLYRSNTATTPVVGQWTEKAMYGKLASIVTMASGFIFAHEAAVSDISRWGRNALSVRRRICKP